MIGKKSEISFVVVLFLVTASLVVAAQLTSSAEAASLDDSMLWASVNVKSAITPGLSDSTLRQISDNKLAMVKNHLGKEVSYSYEQAYRVYTLSNVDIINAFYEKGSLSYCISPDFTWNIPLISGKQTVGTATLSPKDEAWHLSSYGDAPVGEVSSLSDLDKMIALLANKELVNITEIKAVYLPIYRFTILHICSNGEEYVMAVSEVRFADIKTHEIYTVESFINALEKAFGKPVPRDPNEPIFYGIPGVK